MPSMPSLDDLKAVAHAAIMVVGAVSSLCTALALVLPKGSKMGARFARIGADLKGHLE